MTEIERPNDWVYLYDNISCDVVYGSHPHGTSLTFGRSLLLESVDQMRSVLKSISSSFYEQLFYQFPFCQKIANQNFMLTKVYSWVVPESIKHQARTELELLEIRVGVHKTSYTNS